MYTSHVSVPRNDQNVVFYYNYQHFGHQSNNNDISIYTSYHVLLFMLKKLHAPIFISQYAPVDSQSFSWPEELFHPLKIDLSYQPLQTDEYIIKYTITWITNRYFQHKIVFKRTHKFELEVGACQVTYLHNQLKWVQASSAVPTSLMLFFCRDMVSSKLRCRFINDPNMNYEDKILSPVEFSFRVQFSRPIIRNLYKTMTK